MNKVLVLGATGATGSLVVRQLLKMSIDVVVIVRSRARLSDEALENAEVIEAGIFELSDSELREVLEDCDACVSCLGHNLSFKGIFGQPRELVTGVVKKLIRLGNEMNHHFKFVLMGSSGVQNYSAEESPPLSQKLVISALRVLIPPHRDNEQAAAALSQIGTSEGAIFEWVVVRPDTLVDREEVGDYLLFESPIRNVIFNAGETSRINVADFMSRLLIEDDLWRKWVGKMPVIYNNHNLAPS